MNKQTHWDTIYQNKSPNEVSWYQEKPVISLELIKSVALKPEDFLIDVGAGASTLCDYLLAQGYRHLTVLDLSANALAYSRQRLGDKASLIDWQLADITQFLPSQRYHFWHDRAVFHFLIDASEREQYKQVLNASIDAGGYVMIAAFSIGGAKKCSGLDVVQYDAEKLAAELGEQFVFVTERFETHQTPAGNEQAFGYFLFRCLK
jgi:SAM-dependent methyltransferase